MSIGRVGESCGGTYCQIEKCRRLDACLLHLEFPSLQSPKDLAGSKKGYEGRVWDTEQKIKRKG
jgi:hypothetical protein